MQKSEVEGYLRRMPSVYESICGIFLFGSFLKEVDFNDVDSVFVFGELKATQQTRMMSREFLLDFGISLHIQAFTIHQAEHLSTFLDTAGSWKRVYGKRPSP